jgi:hypothetical protein
MFQKENQLPEKFDKKIFIEKNGLAQSNKG